MCVCVCVCDVVGACPELGVAPAPSLPRKYPLVHPGRLAPSPPRYWRNVTFSFRTATQLALARKGKEPHDDWRVDADLRVDAFPSIERALER